MAPNKQLTEDQPQIQETVKPKKGPITEDQPDQTNLEEIEEEDKPSGVLTEDL